jgi:hypothetical protein
MPRYYFVETRPSPEIEHKQDCPVRIAYLRPKDTLYCLICCHPSSPLLGSSGTAIDNYAHCCLFLSSYPYLQIRLRGASYLLGSLYPPATACRPPSASHHLRHCCRCNPTTPWPGAIIARTRWQSNRHNPPKSPISCFAHPISLSSTNHLAPKPSREKAHISLSSPSPWPLVRRTSASRPLRSTSPARYVFFWLPPPAGRSGLVPVFWTPFFFVPLNPSISCPSLGAPTSLTSRHFTHCSTLSSPSSRSSMASAPESTPSASARPRCPFATIARVSARVVCLPYRLISPTASTLPLFKPSHRENAVTDARDTSQTSTLLP